MRRKRSEVESRHSSENDARSRSGYVEYRKSNSDRISAKVPRAFQGRRKIAGGTAPYLYPVSRATYRALQMKGAVGV